MEVKVSPTVVVVEQQQPKKEEEDREATQVHLSLSEWILLLLQQHDLLTLVVVVAAMAGAINNVLIHPLIHPLRPWQWGKGVLLLFHLKLIAAATMIVGRCRQVFFVLLPQLLLHPSPQSGPHQHNTRLSINHRHFLLLLHHQRHLLHQINKDK